MKRKVLVSMLCASMIGSMMTGMTVSADEPVTLDLYLDFTWFPTDSWTGIIPETLTENGGVTFDVTRSADDSQLGLMIASGDLPDVIFTCLLYTSFQAFRQIPGRQIPVLETGSMMPDRPIRSRNRSLKCW